jgi:GWxTD domain-containing protein
MKKLAGVWLLLFIAGIGTLPAQTVLHGKGRFLIDIDYSRYFGDERQVYVEVYYGIHENSITYQNSTTGFSGSVKMRLTVRSESAAVADKEWLVPHEISDSSKMASTQIMTGLETVALPAGSYKLVVQSWDVNDPTRKDSLVTDLPIAFFPANAEAMSDLELCTMIQTSTNKESIFYKNTFEVIPNPARLFGVGIPIMYYYLELYNLSSAGGESTVLRTSITNAAGKEMFSKDKPKPRTMNSTVEVGSMNLSAMKGGTYLMRASLLDSVKQKVLASTTKKFFIYKPGGAPDSTISPSRQDLLGSEYAVMQEEELNRELGYISYLPTDMERQQMNQLTDVHSKQKFLFDFWKRRDPDPSTPENEFKMEYMKRVEYADRMYTGGFKKGWKSDRGRVYIVYGPADEIERYPSTTDANPYEVWRYSNIQGGVQFVFVDKNSMNDYALVHSTHRDELHNPDWYNEYAAKSK